LRALRILNESDLIICEENKESVRFLHFFGIKKDFVLLNEHNEKEVTDEYLSELSNGKNIALISDCGTPAFADPGLNLIQKCIEYNIQLDFLPGANSVLAAIVISGFDISRFYYVGFLSPKKEVRKKELHELEPLDKTFVIMDAPYRLTAMLNDLEKIFPNRNLFIGFNLTMMNEMQLRGTASEILNYLEELYPGKKLKGEFVIVVNKP
jgi:16S rRNA (cytidine1402-2'-O)-methyltransferase